MIDFSPTQSLCTDIDTEPEPEPHPFATVPGMEDCPLAGLKSALLRQHSADAPSVRQTALWTQSGGGDQRLGPRKHLGLMPCTPARTARGCLQFNPWTCPRSCHLVTTSGNMIMRLKATEVAWMYSKSPVKGARTHGTPPGLRPGAG